MCGISAFFSKKPISIKDFNNFRDSVAHRGPDNAQTKIYKYDDKFLALGHRRLSIIDLNDKAKQPMSYGSCHIIFNGEIYNYLEIKNELKKKGITFETKSDTEVLLKSYIYWKEKCLDKFNGMFSFLIIDQDKKKIFFARDRFGIKPLYYYRNDHTLYFASEIKQFMTLCDFEPVGNINAIGNFIDNRYLDYSEETFFRGVYQIKGGEAGFINLSDLKINKYIWYDLAKTNPKKSTTFKEKFNKSIEYRLRSDVEVGSCLSGGVDSSSIVCLADKKLSRVKKKYTLRTFTSCFIDKEFDERNLVNITKKQTSIKAHYIFPQENEFFKDLDKLIYAQDEPIWSSSIYAQSCVLKEANNNGVKVILDGQGADEIFCGYTSIFYPTYFKSLSFKKKIEEIFNSSNKKSAIKLLLKSIFKIKEVNKFSILKKKYNNKFSNEFKSLKDHTVYFMKYHLPALLHYEDRNSMRYSIEARLPFLDYQLVEAGFHLEDYKKIGLGLGKKIIRESLRGITPNEILDNKVKKGFITPQRKWMENNKQIILENIRLLFQLNIFKEDSLEKILNNFKKNNYKEGLIMRLYTFSAWIKIFNIKKIV